MKNLIKNKQTTKKCMETRHQELARSLARAEMTLLFALVINLMRFESLLKQNNNNSSGGGGTRKKTQIF